MATFNEMKNMFEVYDQLNSDSKLRMLFTYTYLIANATALKAHIRELDKFWKSELRKAKERRDNEAKPSVEPNEKDS